MIREIKFTDGVTVGFDEAGILFVEVPKVPRTGLEAFLPDHLYSYMIDEVSSGKFRMTWYQRARLCFWLSAWNTLGYEQGPFGYTARKVALVFHDALRLSVNRVDDE